MNTVVTAIADQCNELVDITGEKTIVENAVEQLKLTLNAKDSTIKQKHQLIASFEKSLEQKRDKLKTHQQKSTELGAEKLTLQNTIKNLEATLKTTTTELSKKNKEVTCIEKLLQTRQDKKDKELEKMEHLVFL